MCKLFEYFWKPKNTIILNQTLNYQEILSNPQTKKEKKEVKNDSSGWPFKGFSPQTECFKFMV